ncbi:MAG: hypothetical protein ABI036_02995 [Fibrobacteria bacterium]
MPSGRERRAATAFPFRGRLGALAACAAALLFQGCLFETRTQLPVILFMGNSITLKAPAPELGWTGNWGMAATAADSDYAHQTMRLLRENGMDLQMEIGERNCPVCDGAIDEQTREVEQIRRLHPRYVVVQLSEHSFDTELRSGKMTEQYRRLLAMLRREGVPQVLCLGAWGEKDTDQPHAQGIMQALMDFTEYRFVDISAAARDTLNYADTTVFKDAGVAWHPGNRGMLAIAEILSDAVLSGK